jgi:hypothetical protein
MQYPVPGKGKAVASLVLGILSVVFCWFGYIAAASLILSIIGLVLSVSAKKEMQVSGNYMARGLSTGGLVLSIIGLSLSAILFICFLVCVSTISSFTSYNWLF